MGARVYLPELGGFLQVDPVEGGTLNNYVYAMDPVNQWDLSGKFLNFRLFLSPLKIITNPISLSKTQSVAEVTSYYSHWLFGRGRSKSIQANTYKWRVTAVPKAYSGKNGTHSVKNARIIVQAQGFQGGEIVNSANAIATGKLTVKGNSWTFKGTASSIKDTYNFDHQKGGSLQRNFATGIGAFGGGVCVGITLGACRPTDYSLDIYGIISVEGSGTF